MSKLACLASAAAASPPANTQDLDTVVAVPRPLLSPKACVNRLLTPSVFMSVWLHLPLWLCVSLQMRVCVFTSTSVCVCGLHSQVSLGLLVLSTCLMLDRFFCLYKVALQCIKCCWVFLKHFLCARFGLVQAEIIHLDPCELHQLQRSFGFKIEIRTAQTALSGLGACCQLE